MVAATSFRSTCWGCRISQGSIGRRSVGKLCELTRKICDTARSRREASSPAFPIYSATPRIRQGCHDWNNNEDFFRYTAGRFLFEERNQMASRYVKFDMNELVHIAAKSIASRSCVEVRKLPEGQYNKAFLLTMDDGKRVIAKVPNPNAGRPHYTTASEVATMDFIRTVLQLPVPEVYAWNSRAAANPVGAEYIIMAEARGVPLSQKWPSLEWGHKINLVKKLVETETTLTSASFGEYGSLYYAADLELPAQEDVLYTDSTGRTIVNAQFSIGPTTNLKSFVNDRANVDFDRGPWATAEEYVASIGRREIQCSQEVKQLPKPIGIVNGPGLYQTSRDSKLSVLNDFLKVASYLLPIDRSVSSACLWHGDLHSDNIFVNPEKPAEITCLIDWQSVHVEPLFMQACHPSFLNFEGPKPEGVVDPSLPEDFNEMNEVQQERAKSLLPQQRLFKAYELLSFQKNKQVYDALQHQKTLGCQTIAFAGVLLEDGEPLVKGQLIQVQREWQTVPAVRARGYPPCPLLYTSQDVLDQDTEFSKWIQGMELMDQVLELLGTVDKGWYGGVKTEEYAFFKEKLDNAREDFLNDLSETEEDRPKWLLAWPFKD